MSLAFVRTSLRWFHILAGILIATYIFSPLHLDSRATLFVRISLVPLVGLTGIAMWQQGRFRRLLQLLHGSKLDLVRK